MEEGNHVKQTWFVPITTMAMPVVEMVSFTFRFRTLESAGSFSHKNKKSHGHNIK